MPNVGNIPQYGTTGWEQIVKNLRSGGQIKFHVAFDDPLLQVPSLGATLTFDAIPPNSYVSAAWIVLSDLFTGTLITAVNADVGIVGGVKRYIYAADILTDPAPATLPYVIRNKPGEQFDGSNTPVNDGGNTLAILITATGDNLDQLATGQLDVYIVYETFI
ncbi:MAG: hypothetical protein NUW37_00005 [Planctomycetes bacterium]|nr:hypothetical protein [Planctomycetota bacterium]